MVIPGLNGMKKNDTNKSIKKQALFYCLRRPGALFVKTAPGPCKNFLLIGPVLLCVSLRLFYYFNQLVGG
jgi:hypothetical protein